METEKNSALVFGKYPKRRPWGYRINWDKVRNDYIFAEPIIDEKTKSYRYPSIADIAKKNNANIATTYIRSSKENWQEKRAMYQSKVSQLHDLEYGAIQLRRSALFDEENMERLGKFTEIFDKWMGELEERVETQNETPVKGTDLKDAIDVMQKMHKLHRDIMGEPVNYYEFYKEKLREERAISEKGRAVTRNEIRDLISAVRKKETGLTLDVSAEEEEEMRRIGEIGD